MRALPILLLLLPALAAQAQTAKTTNTLALSDSTAGLGVSLDLISEYLSGTWQGEGLGGKVDEIWTEAAGNQMHGLFRLIHGDTIALSEHMVVDLLDGRPTLRVKHFSNTFEAWEQAAEAVNFPLVRADAEGLYFDGLTIRRDGNDRLIYYLAMGTASGLQEMELIYNRVR